jgi:hypothetical protein
MSKEASLTAVLESKEDHADPMTYLVRPATTFADDEDGIDCSNVVLSVSGCNAVASLHCSKDILSTLATDMASTSIISTPTTAMTTNNHWCVVDPFCNDDNRQDPYENIVVTSCHWDDALTASPHSILEVPSLLRSPSRLAMSMELLASEDDDDDDDFCDNFELVSYSTDMIRHTHRQMLQQQLERETTMFATA